MFITVYIRPLFTNPVTVTNRQLLSLIFMFLCLAMTKPP